MMDSVALIAGGWQSELFLEKWLTVGINGAIFK